MTLRYAKAAPENYHYPLLIRQLLSNLLTVAGDRKIHYRDEVSFTYPEFIGRVGRLASMLSGVGVRQGTMVSVMDWDSHRYLESYFAVPMMGAVLHTVNVRLPAPQVAYTLDHADAEVLLVHRDFYPLLEEILPGLPKVRAIIAIDDGKGDLPPPWAVGEYELLLAAASPDFPFEDFDENAVATLFYTTGTTGNPKGVCFTHRQLVLQTLNGKAPFGGGPHSHSLGHGDVYMPLTPMFHVHAWGAPYVATMLGLEQVYPGRYEPDMICQLRQRYKVTYSHCVPTILQMVLEAADRTGIDLSNWRMIIGGSALTKALYKEGRQRGMAIFAGYGMSETAPTVAHSRPLLDEGDDQDALADSMTASGVPAPLVQVRIVDSEMRDVPHDGQSRGELVLRTPWLTQCYVGNDEASADLWRGGWMHTQDLATIDRHGRIRIRDRLKDIIKSGGEWIDSLQLEELVGLADGVAAVSVVAVPDARWGERPFAVVKVQVGANPTLDDINAPVNRAIAQGAITKYARIDQFLVVDDLPKTSVGKIDKKALRAMLEAQQSG